MIWCLVRLFPHQCWQLSLTVVGLVRLDSRRPRDTLKEHAAYATHDPAKVFFFWGEIVLGSVGTLKMTSTQSVFLGRVASAFLLKSCLPACLHSARQTASSTSTYAFTGPNSYLCSMQAQISAQIKQRKYAASSNVIHDAVAFFAASSAIYFFDENFDQCNKRRLKK